jgi:nitrogen fixation protein NifU and related proteins
VPLPDPFGALYQETILTHYRRPHNRGTLDPADASATRVNPLCGETITVTVTTDDERVSAIRFDGRGCSIAQASASMMTDAVRGLDSAQIAELAGRLRTLVTGGETDPKLGDLNALAGVARVPARVACAMLAWNALTDALAVAQADR